MRSAACIASLTALFAVSAFCQTGTSRGDSKTARDSAPRTPAGPRADESGAIELLKRAEAEAVGLEGEMRAWALWRIGWAFQSSERAKALDLFEAALAAARSIRDKGPDKKPAKDVMSPLTGHPSLSLRLGLQADIAQSIIRLDPKRADQVIEELDPAARGEVLESLLVHQAEAKRIDAALETLQRITALDEMPYDSAMRLMDNLRAEQSGELTQAFVAALASYRDHAPHLQFRDEFPVMLSRYWKRLPQAVVRQAVDEVLKQAADTTMKGSYSVVTDKGASALGSIYELRLYQIMPVLRELEPSAAREYQEKYPALASSGASSEAAYPPASGGAAFRPSQGYNSVITSGREMPAAQKAATQVDSGLADEAMSRAAGIMDVNLRAQVYEYIARVTAKKRADVAAEAIQSMLDAAKKLQPDEGFRYYSVAAEIYMQMGEEQDAKQSIEAGLSAGDKLYQADADVDDPNTALKAFWPSTNAYCTLLREAARISPAWATSLLRNIKDSELRVAAEIALASGWLQAPLGPSKWVITKKRSSSSFVSTRE